MHRTQILVATLFCSWVAVSPLEAQGQPLSPVRESGQSVSPAFEGWYRNPDGTISLSFGYFNRNATEVVELPIGPNNFFTPGPADRGQPTSFQPRRHWGVFAVTVPANWPPRDKVVWTLVIKGDTLRVPGHLRPNWELDALQGEAGSGNTPPRSSFRPTGKRVLGPEAQRPACHSSPKLAWQSKCRSGPPMTARDARRSAVWHAAARFR